MTSWMMVKRATTAVVGAGVAGAAVFWNALHPALPPTLHFKQNAANAALLEQCPLLSQPLEPPPFYLRNANTQMLLHDRKKRWGSDEILLKRQVLTHPDGGTTALDWVHDAGNDEDGVDDSNGDEMKRNPPAPAHNYATRSSGGALPPRSDQNVLFSFYVPVPKRLMSTCNALDDGDVIRS